MKRMLVACLWLCVLASGTWASNDLYQRVEAWQAGFPAVALGQPLYHSHALIHFYQARGFKTLWVAENGLTEQAKQLIHEIDSIGNEGLLPEDYSAALFVQWLREPAALSTELLDAELLLSDRFLTLVNHLSAGKTDPNQVAEQWRAPLVSDQGLVFLEKMAAGQALATVLDSARPQQARYRRLIDALAQMRALATEPWPAFSLRPSIKREGRDSRLPDIARRLQLLGDLDVQWSGSSLDADLIEAVRNFQRRHGLQQDGDIGPETFRALNVTPAERAVQIMVNLERWRWLDSDLGKKFLLVNIAGFDLRVIENDDRILQQPVIVGRDYRKTPVFSDKIRYLVFNPTWTVPAKLAIQDKLPEIKANPNYLAEYGFTVYRGGSQDIVDPSTVDWATVNAKNFNFRLVQAPGPLNALGQVKFMFPNSHDVYLHDTPARELFDKHQRAFSSGCIRVADPLLLAELLLKEEGWTREQIDQLVASGVTKTVPLKTPVPVHIEYWTAWVDSRNTLYFRNDIYQRDRVLYESLIQPLSPPAAH
ncbi:murein L,D-transpeptidase YcbB/YkuD [Simiduia aestuariiviva]|uniref:Murein L,D-transpeptidase YcbB/YkuD n=2 Tax=Simiduia aestuariiviva TaxID=1510459 RepID=A0A839UTJ7_9GAMM|nr:murein L,D-transpeptidase YcbB/YkuD [Simiduia aestuariiviva]